MALKWEKKLYWRDEKDGKLYLHPIAAFTTIGVVVILGAYLLFAYV